MELWDSYEWPYEWVTAVRTKTSGVTFTLLLSGDGAHLVQKQFLERDCFHPDFSGVRYTPTKETHVKIDFYPTMFGT